MRLAIYFAILICLISFRGFDYVKAETFNDPKFEKKIIVEGLTYLFGFSAGDFDNDGFWDFGVPDVRRGTEATRTKNGTQISDLYVAYGSASGRSKLALIDEGQPGFYERQTAGDINGDGLLDIVVVNNRDSEVFWFQNLGDRKWQKHQITSELRRPYDVVISDFNNDGYGDVVVSGYVSNELTLFQNLMGEPSWLRTLFPKVPLWKKIRLGDKLSENRFVAAGDIDLDGKVDIISGSAGASGLPANVLEPKTHAARLVWFKNPGPDGELWIENTIDDTNAARGIAHGQLIDLDKDGRLEILVAKGMREEIIPAEDHRVDIYKNHGSQSWTSKVLKRQQNIFDVKAGFINRDQIVDYVMVSHVPANLITVLLSEGRGYRSIILDNSIAAPNTIELLDFDNDGDLDVIVSADNGNGSNRVKGGNRLVAFINPF